MTCMATADLQESKAYQEHPENLTTTTQAYKEATVAIHLPGVAELQAFIEDHPMMVEVVHLTPTTQTGMETPIGLKEGSSRRWFSTRRQKRLSCPIFLKLINTGLG